MRVADIDEGEREGTPGGVDRGVDGLALEAGELVSPELRDAHVDGDAVALAETRYDLARPGLEHDAVAAQEALHVQLASDHTHAVAAHLRLGTVRVEDLQSETVLAGTRADDEDAVGSDTDVAVAKQAHTPGREVEGDLLTVEDDVVVPETLPLRELHLPETRRCRLHA